MLAGPVGAGPVAIATSSPDSVDAAATDPAQVSLISATGAIADATRFYPTANTAASSRVYTVDPRDHLRADRDAEDHGLEINGVVHSHTHTEPYPSPTDVAQAPDPSWHYVIVSFRTGVASLRSYRIVDGVVSEEPVRIVDG